MATIGAIGDISKYFDSPSYSDITIVFASEHGDCGLHAHKLVLAQHSEFFRKAFEGGFKEANQTEIRLHDDSYNAVIGMIAYCYGLTFDGRSEYSKDGLIVHEDFRSACYVRHTVDLYIAADKYGIASFCNKILIDFPGMLLGITGSVSEMYPVYLDQVARQVYVDHAVAAKELRKPVIEVFAKHIKLWVGAREFEQLVLDVPELAVELFRALAGGQSPDKGKKSTTGGAIQCGQKRAGKRKMSEAEALAAQNNQYW